MSYHEAVMAREALEGLSIRPDGVYVDVTFGGGGHSRLILGQLGTKGRLIAFDQDEDARRNLFPDGRLEFIPHNFRYLKKFLRVSGISAVDGILADLGVSSHQLDEASRGFSFRFDHALDMRMTAQGELTAAQVLNTYPAERLQAILSAYGELRNSRTLAEAIVAERGHRELRTIADLVGIAEPLIRGNRHRYLAQLFQALRIEVNDEIGALRDFLGQAIDVLRPGGRLVVIAYHSVEDRMVKHSMKTGNTDGRAESDFFGHIYRPYRIITKKAIQPGDAELRSNPRSRSAKLRIAERTDEQQHAPDA
jgi:16S rRNA (cytosine1402-N4)-methyltransferase